MHGEIGARRSTLHATLILRAHSSRLADTQALSNTPKSGYDKGTLGDDVRYPSAPNEVRRHRLISISYISCCPVTVTVRWCGRVREDTTGNRKESDDTIIL